LPDVTVTVPADAVGHAIFEREKLFSAVKLGGAADVAESFAFVLRNLRWDVESDLAQFVGDIPARRLNLLGNSLFLDVRNGFQKLAENFKEYAIEDSLLLAADRNIYDFGLEVNRIRDDVDRLEKRISKL
jgi:ubiquinone biosynthesis protein UbiJ